MQLEDFLNRVATVGAIPHAQVDRAVAATLSALGERLDEQEARAVAEALPVPLAHALLARPHGAEFDLAELYDRVCVREDVAPGFAREHAQAVLEVIGYVLPADTRARLARHLPAELMELFAQHDRAPHPPEPAPHVHVETRSAALRRMLATGRPGSDHPVSSSRPRDAHAQSVARSTDPHGDTKLSGAHGTTQERMGDTLAEGEPPAPKRTIARD